MKKELKILFWRQGFPGWTRTHSIAQIDLKPPVASALAS